jgi:hypothetical protein
MLNPSMYVKCLIHVAVLFTGVLPDARDRPRAAL